MSLTVILLLGRDRDAPVDWAFVKANSVTTSGHAASLEELSSALPDADQEPDIIAVLPGEDAVLRGMPTPPRQQAKFLSAARFLLEDNLAGDIEACHVAVLKRDQGAQIAAIETSRVAEWLEALGSAGLTPSVLTFDHACLHGTRDRGVMFIDQSRIIANFGERGFAAEPELAKDVIASFLSKNPDASIGVYSPKDTSLSEASRYEHLGDAGRDQLALLVAEAVQEGNAVNLLQGAFRAPRKPVIDATIWKRPAALAASLAIIASAGFIADGMRAGRIADHYTAEAQRIHAAAFPDQANSDMRSHARQILGSGGDVSFAAISDKIGRALINHDNVSIDRVRFDNRRGAYVFAIRSTSDAEITAFRETLAGLGAASQETSGYRRSGAFWVGELTVTG